MPLCPQLHTNLHKKFGKVALANEGMNLQARQIHTAYEIKMEIISPGEYYRVNCPFCGDRRQRLWINHRFAEFPYLAVCYNETRCMQGPQGKENRQKLYNIVFDSSVSVVLPVKEGQNIDVVTPLGEVPLPGEIMFFSELDEAHPAKRYLEGRGYDVSLLERLYGVGYCQKTFDKHNYPLTSRIFIPIIMNGKLVGWQGRFVGDPDWKLSSVQKYFNLRGMSKKHMLYNFDVAKHSDMVVLVEGVADVWRVGPEAVGILGSDLTETQVGLIRKTWQDKPVAVFLDIDNIKGTRSIVNRLYPFFGNKVFAVIPDNGKDPGSMSEEECWQLINKELRSRGLPVRGSHERVVQEPVLGA
jgi:hypothetical protein